MRDIEQISKNVPTSSRVRSMLHHAHFEKVMQQLQAERDAKLAELTRDPGYDQQAHAIRNWHRGQSCDAAASSGLKASGRKSFAGGQDTVS